MKCLVYDKASMPWDKTRGFEKREVPVPVLDESADPYDAESVLIKVIYAGFCGSDRRYLKSGRHGSFHCLQQ